MTDLQEVKEQIDQLRTDIKTTATAEDLRKTLDLVRRDLADAIRRPTNDCSLDQHAFQEMTTQIGVIYCRRCGTGKRLDIPTTADGADVVG